MPAWLRFGSFGDLVDHLYDRSATFVQDAGECAPWAVHVQYGPISAHVHPWWSL